MQILSAAKSAGHGQVRQGIWLTEVAPDCAAPDKD